MDERPDFATAMMDEVRRLDEFERQSIRRDAEAAAANFIGAVVAAVGGEVRVSAIHRLERYVVEMREEPVTGEVVVRAWLEGSRRKGVETNRG